ncbi:two-component system QseEF-associated lipoprotein QseG [Serratia sp. S1B]|nr:two-component system QseEF-associated lipoprotein QseG [Serratia sp. S1B]
MYTGSNCAHLTHTEGLSRVSRRVFLGKNSFSFLGSFFLAPVLLTGCTPHSTSSTVVQQQETVTHPKVADFRTASCDTLLQLDEKESLANSLYWLRALDCADRLGSTQARSLAKTLPGGNWSNVVKQGMLLASAEPTAAERRQLIARLDSYHLEFPDSVRPLLQLWRQQQVLQVSLTDERARYQQLQQSTDNQIESLHQNQLRLQNQLQVTSRKLENLTDIERQLSSRKQLQGEIPESTTTQSKVEVGKHATPAKAVEADHPAETKKATPSEHNVPAQVAAPPAKVAESKPAVSTVPAQVATPSVKAAAPKPAASTAPAQGATPPAKAAEPKPATSSAPAKAAEPEQAPATGTAIPAQPIETEDIYGPVPVYKRDSAQ